MFITNVVRVITLFKLITMTTGSLRVTILEELIVIPPSWSSDTRCVSLCAKYNAITNVLADHELCSFEALDIATPSTLPFEPVFRMDMSSVGGLGGAASV